MTSSCGLTFEAPIVLDTRPSSNRVIARHGLPNYFRIPGPSLRRQSRYVGRCLRLVERSGAARIEAKGTIRAHRWGPVATRFTISGSEPGPADLYDGPATVAVGGRVTECRVRLLCHLDAIDGQQHWQGTVYDIVVERVNSSAELTLGGRTAVARIVERTPWGNYMIAGVGPVPFG